MKIWTDDVVAVAGDTLGQAFAAAEKQTGYPYAEDRDAVFIRLMDDDELLIWIDTRTGTIAPLDEVGGPSSPDYYSICTGQARLWADEFGPGLIYTTEF